MANVSPTPTPTPHGTISIEAGLVYTSGDTKPVARTVFSLLDEDPAQTLEISYNCAHDLRCLGATVENWRSRERLSRTLGQPGVNMQEKLTPHIIATATTDFGGKAKFESLMPGRRFLFGYFAIGEPPYEEVVAWNIEIEILPGKDTALILDNSGGSIR